MNLVKRSYKKELLDEDNIPFANIKQNMQELDFINTHLGGHAITIKGLKTLVGGRNHISVCEIGCGGGDNLLAIQNWCNKNKIQISLIGIDIKQECIDFAKSRTQFNNETKWLTTDYRKISFDKKPDIIFSSLFCHHFNDDELIEQLKWMQSNCAVGFFINDLQRHSLAYYLIKALAQMFSKSYLVKNDAPLSVARGLKKNEWKTILDKANITRVSINWKWAFRYLIIYKH